MRNSLTPLVFVVLVAVAAVLLTRSDVEPGMGGPTIYPGIFRLPTKERFHIVSADLEGHAVARRRMADGSKRQAPRGDEWRVVVVSADDQQALTRSTVLALAEKLTAYGAVVVVDPLDSPAFPLGAERVLRVSTTKEELPAEPTGDCQAEVTIVSRLLRPTDNHPMARLMPATNSDQEIALGVTLSSRGKAGSTMHWPERYAAMGRSITDAGLAELAPAGLPPLVDPKTRTWLPTLLPRADWGSTLWLPPSSDTLRWDGAMQEAFVRGWVGTINGTVSLDRTGAPLSSLKPLLDRLKRANWSEQSEGADLIPGRRLFTSQREGESRWLTIDERPHGWEVVVWQERTGLVAMVEGWIAAGAMQELAAYRQCQALPTDLRTRMGAALAAQAEGANADKAKTDVSK